MVGRRYATTALLDLAQNTLDARWPIQLCAVLALRQMQQELGCGSMVINGSHAANVRLHSRRIGSITQQETNMGAALVRDLVNKLASTLRSLREPAEFVCSDCERWDRCGMLSSDECVFKAEQIARGDWKMRRLAKAFSLATGRPTPLG